MPAGADTVARPSPPWLGAEAKAASRPHLPDSREAPTQERHPPLRGPRTASSTGFPDNHHMLTLPLIIPATRFISTWHIVSYVQKRPCCVSATCSGPNHSISPGIKHLSALRSVNMLFLAPEGRSCSPGATESRNILVCGYIQRQQGRKTGEFHRRRQLSQTRQPPPARARHAPSFWVPHAS